MCHTLATPLRKRALEYVHKTLVPFTMTIKYVKQEMQVEPMRKILSENN